VYLLSATDKHVSVRGKKCSYFKYVMCPKNNFVKNVHRNM